MSDNPQKYELVVETGAVFDMKLANGGDYITVDRNVHTAVLVARQAAAQFLGAKVCRGIFLTSDEAAHLKKNDEQKTKQK